MPLHGKIVVIKRSGGDGTEFPLTAACLFGRKPECDIRIQLPQVSKEHCRIELNENKEVILTNLSSVNPTLINGKPMQQSERLKHGDLITIIDRSFRFECPPEPTPKKNIPPAKRKSETLQVLQEHQVREADALVSGEKGKYPQTPEQTCLKDGTNMVLASVGDGDEAVGKQAFVTSLDQSKSTAKEALSPFCELYEITKQSLSEKLSRKSEQPKTPCSRRDSKMEVVPQNKSPDKPDSASGADVTPKSGRRSMKTTPGRDELASPTQKLQDAIEQVVTPVQVTPKLRRSLKSPAKQLKAAFSEDQLTPVSQKKNHISTPQKITAAEVVQHVISQGTSVLEDYTISKSVTPKTRRSKEAHSPAGEGGPCSPGCPFVCTPNQAEKNGESGEVKEKSPRAKGVSSSRTSPRTTAGKLQALSVLETAAPSCGENEDGQSGRYKKRKSGDLGDLPVPLMKRKRVSFGGQLSPELFDKRLPPNSPLRKGATPGRRSLSVLKKQPVLRRASIIGLIQELPSEQSSSENPKASSPRMRVSSKAGSTSRTPSPKKTPAAKSKTPSPGKIKSPKVKPGTPSKEKEPKKSPARKSSPKTSNQSPSRCKSSSKENPLSKGLKSPASQPQTPVSVFGKTATPRRRESSSAGSKSSPKTTSPEGESLSAEMPINDSLASQTPIVRGRFSISRIETPSPVTDQDTAASDGSVSVTPSVLLRRVSLKSAKATPKSARRRSALELIRLRRSGASQANLKVVSSWADIVKFGTTKAQTEIRAKKRISRGKAVRTVKQKPKPPKTPIQKLKGHFSTGHAESPATIVVGKAHAKAVLPTGCAPKFVRNAALTKESMNMNEDLTGIAEIFSTPVNTRRKRANSGKPQSPKTPQDQEVPLAEASVINTPEETGEMVVSPLSVANTVKQGCYNSEAVVRLLTDDQECSFTCSDSVQQKATSDVISSEHAEQQDLVLERMVVTPRQKPEPEMPLTGVKRLMKTPKQKVMQKEALTGIKRLLKTPKQAKVSEVSLIGVKELLKTPNVKGQPIDMVGVQRVMKTPKVKAELFTTGVKRLMRTPKLKNEPVDDMVGLKRLMRTPKQKNIPVKDSFGVKQLLQTPKQKNEPVEDMVGLKRLMRTPKQKNEPVEDMVGLKRLMRTPKQKNEPVEDVVGLKRLMRTPKQKGKPVENKFGIAKLMKSPRIRGTIAVEDYTGLQELMQEPEVPVARIISKCDISEHVCANPCTSVNGEIFTSAEAKVAFEEPLELPESQSNTSKKAVRGRKKTAVPAEDESADSKRDRAVRAAEPNISEVKSKRGRQTRRGLPSTLGVEVLTPAVATPVKTTRGRRAKLVPGAAEDKPDENMSRSKAGKPIESNETMHAEQEITEQGAQVEPSAEARQGSKAAAVPKNALAPVRKAGRGRQAKRMADTKAAVEMQSVEMELLSPKVVDGHGQELASSSQVTKPRRGKKSKSDENTTASESLKKDVAEKETNLVTVAEEPASPIVKPHRGRKPKTLVKEVEQPSPAVLPARRMRRGGPSDATAVTASPSVHSLKPGRGKKVLDTQEVPQEEKLLQPNASSTEVGIKSIRNTRGSRKNNPIADAGTASVCVAAPVPSKVESMVPPNESLGLDNLVIENKKNTTRRGKAAPQDPEANKADKKSAMEQTVAIKAAVKRVVSKKTAKWDLEIPDSQDVTELPGSKKRSGVAGREIVDMSAEKTTEPSTKPRRGRGAKKPSSECSEPAVSEQRSATQSESTAPPLKSSKVNEPVAKDITAAKRGTKRTIARDESVEHLEEASTTSPSRLSTTKRVRGKAARIEENKPAASPARGQRGPLKKAVKTTEKLEGSQKVETPKPVGRSRKRVVQHMEPEPVSRGKQPGRGNARITEPSDAGKVKSAARGRRKSPTKPEAPSVTEARPVRSTRRK